MGPKWRNLGQNVENSGSKMAGMVGVASKFWGGALKIWGPNGGNLGRKGGNWGRGLKIWGRGLKVWGAGLQNSGAWPQHLYEKGELGPKGIGLGAWPRDLGAWLQTCIEIGEIGSKIRFGGVASALVPNGGKRRWGLKMAEMWAGLKGWGGLGCHIWAWVRLKGFNSIQTFPNWFVLVQTGPNWFVLVPAPPPGQPGLP